MRIVTRPDFDGVVCAALLYEAENVNVPVKWVEPNDMQKGIVDIHEGDIVANLPYDERCTLWFDHHHTNKIDKPFNGSFKIAPSAAGIDKIDSADLSLDEVLHPEKYEYVLLSMTVLGCDIHDEPYWNRLVDLLRKFEIQRVLQDPEVKAHCDAVVEMNKEYKKVLQENTELIEHVSVTDFRSFDKTPAGNRFLVYSMFPEAVVSVKIRYDIDDKETVAVSVGHSIFNRNCHVNVGLMLSNFEGGGHRGAGSCQFHVSKAQENIPKILDILLKNQDNEN
ncbi:MAG: exopolyphosphatase [Deltaproteobacteria bacterium]|nr:exopolyphosphatase [Deltaproteobacteria bacterium]